jgi:arylformamidase
MKPSYKNQPHKFDGILFLFLMVFLINTGSSAELPVPDKSDVSYGPHDRNQLDLWLAKSDQPTPLLVYIHGGGWNANDKSQIKGRVNVSFWLKRGVSVASISYRLLKDAPLPAPVHDAVRAIQFLKYRARDFNINPQRMALQGVSAGACSALYILLHDDLADVASADPVLRQSSRVAGAVTQSGQTSIDPFVLKKWIDDKAANYSMIWKGVGAKSAVDHQNNHRVYKTLSQQFSPITHLDKNDPPVYMSYGHDLTIPSKNPAHAIHHGNFGLKFKEQADEIGYDCHLFIKGIVKPKELTSPIAYLEAIFFQ